MLGNNNIIKDSKVCLILALVVIINQHQVSDARKHKDRPQQLYERPGILAKEILIERGYLAEDFHVRSDDGYWLLVTRGRNPLINNGLGGLPNRVPILFIHGAMESQNGWVLNSFDVKPSDFSNITLADFSLVEANERFGDLPSAKSIAMLALDFGHEIFLMSRRGFPGSQRMDNHSIVGKMEAGKSSKRVVKGPFSAFWKGMTNYGHLFENIRFSLDRKFWNFSMDEQAAYDFPKVVNFVREHTKRDKIAVTAHSVGGAITLMSLSLYPELNDKLTAVILWSQVFSAGHWDLVNIYQIAGPFLKWYIGPFPSAWFGSQLQAIMGVFCSNKLSQILFCTRLADIALGFSGANATPMRPEFINTFFVPSSSHELAQIGQNSYMDGQMHYYTDKAYGKSRAYNLSAITNTAISFYSGKTDNLVSFDDGKATRPKLSVPARFHPIEGFNHNAYFFHKNCSRAATIPALREIQEFSGNPQRIATRFTSPRQT